MARIKLVYLGGGSTRAAGTMASLIANGADFEGSEVVLVDLDEDRLALIRTLAEKMARARGHDIAVTATTDRRAALADCDAVLSSFRPGGFEARVRDERIPLDHGLIGQETQGAGGFFMALRAVAVLKDVCAEMEELCPDAWIFNYTNPVNIVAEAVTHHSPVKVVSLCEGPIYFTHEIAESAGLDPGASPRDDGRAEPRLLGRRARLRRAGPAAAPRGGVGAAARRPDARAAPAAAAPARRDDGVGPGGLFRVLLLHRRRPGGAPCQADDEVGGHPRLVGRLLAPLRGAGAAATTRSSTRLAHAAASTSSSSRST